MNHVAADKALRALPSTADEWFAFRRSPERADRDEAIFDEWLGADPRHVEDYAECERLWNARDRMAAHSDLVHRAFAEAGLSEEFGRLRSKRRAWAAGLALAASLAALAWMIVAPVQKAIEPGAIATARGEQHRIVLSDGSKVQLNTDTFLVARIGPAERRMVLKRGEAFFDVVRDPTRPFVVEVGTSEVRVVGTQFNVRETAGKLEVTVKEGTVNVVPLAARSADIAERVELTRGNRLSYDPEQKLVKVASVDPDRTLAWRGGMIEFDHTTLEEAVAELNRYAPKPLVIEDQNLRSIELSGGFRVGDIGAVLFALRERFEIKAEERDGRVVLTAIAR